MDSNADLGWDWLAVTDFVLSSEGRGAARVILEGELRRGQCPPKPLQLLVRRGEKLGAYEVAGSCVHRISDPSRRQPRLHWRAVFELPPAIVDDPRAEFQLSHPAHGVLALGAPLPVAGALGTGAGELIDLRRPRLGAAALASIAAVVAGFGAIPAAAAAKGYDGSPVTSSTGTLTTTTTTQDPTTPATSDPTTTSTTSDPATTTTVTQTTTTTPDPTTTTATPATTTTTTPDSTTTAVPTTSGPTTTTTITTTSSTTTTLTGVSESSSGIAGGGNAHHTRKHKHRHKQHHARHHNHQQVTSTTTQTCSALGGGTATSHDPGAVHSTNCGAGRRDRHQARQHTRHHRAAHPNGGAGLAERKNKRVKAPAQTSAVAPSVGSAPSAWQSPIMANPFTSAQLRQYAALVGSLTQPPKYLVRIYKAAARRYHIPWQILAAINYVETGYGRDLAVSPAGAVGWMQFMPGTWAEYGQSVTPTGKPAAGTANPWDPNDAIFAAARYLVAAGARRNLAKAVFAYNHAGWYVQEVLSIAEQITRHGLRAGSKAQRKISAMTTMARILNGLPYVWGGGHSNFTMISGGYDCSGFVSAVLHAGGYLKVPVTTQSLPGQPGIKSGPGRWVTIFDRTYAGVGADHVIIDIDGQWWESGGWGSGAARVHRMRHVSAAYLQTFNLVLHPRGL